MGILAEFERPPVIETALAVEFNPIPGWSLAHAGAIWGECYKKQYPKVTVAPTAGPISDFTEPPVRFFVGNETGTQLLQLRAGAFGRNWKASSDAPTYPRYASIRPSFAKDLATFYAYLDANGFERPSIWRGEVTYINHFLQGREWQTPADIYQVIPVVAPHFDGGGILADPIQMQMGLNFALPNDAGTLLLQILPGLDSVGKQLIQLSLTAYGTPKSSSVEDVLGYLDQGHEAVVKAFTELTSTSSQNDIWGRKC